MASPSLVRKAQADRARAADVAVSWLYVFCVSVACASFMKIGTSDPLASVGGVQSIYELLLLALSTVIVFLHLGSLVPLRVLLSAPVCTALLYGMYATTSALWSLEPTLSAGKGAEFVLLVINGAAIGYAIARDQLQRNFFAYVAVGVGLVSIAFLASNQFIHGTPVYLETSDDQRTRLWFAYTHPLSVAHMASLGLLCTVLSRLRLTAKLVLGIFFAWVLYLADARASVIGVGLAGLVLVTLGKRPSSPSSRASQRLFYLFLVLACLSGVAAWVVLNTEELLAALPSDVTSLNGRIGLWSTAFGFVVDDPLRALAGYGYFASRFLLLSYYEWGGHTHQVILEVLLTTGVLGLAAFIYWAKAAFDVATRVPVLLVLLAYFAVVSFDDPVLFQPGVAMIILSWCISLNVATTLLNGRSP